MSTPRAREHGATPLRRIAYFSMEVALAPELATYAGGLGVLAGDALRSLADLAVPAVGVTLLCRAGYLHQEIDEDGNQHESPQHWDFARWLRMRDEAITMRLFDRDVHVRAWQYDLVGADGFVVPILFLDSDVPDNPPDVRALCGALYGDGDRYRLAQELVLGIGGVRMLAAIGHVGLRKYHLNEGHAAFAALEILRASNEGKNAWDFTDVHASCVFTTHTPVPAGHDRFSRALVDEAMGGLVPSDVLDPLVGRDVVNMTELALGLSGHVNGVARHHAEVTRGIFPGHGIGYVTNGVHSQTWTAAPLARMYDRHLPGWRSDSFALRYAGRLPPTELWAAHEEAKAVMLAEVRARTGELLDPGALTIGFARRATSYKRADLVLADPARLRAIAGRAGPIQLVFAGKAHPKDDEGKAIIRAIEAIARELAHDVPIVYVPDYDIALAKLLVSGCDLWLNTPQPPLEASGTSGMKAAHNGVPSLSVLDGWWIEGHLEGSTGWSIAATADRSQAAEELYRKLEHLIVPLFRQHRAAWTRVMQHTIALNASFFNTQRMVQQYVTTAYV